MVVPCDISTVTCMPVVWIMHLPVVNISVIYIAIESGSLVKLTRSTGWCGELQPILPYH